ncbi:hypothetical protein UFOVP816_34 [uncultured Caudovirales phage]|uniref:Uncharacterized protein n=1 Tax=uncultured Caudovirales phage TaxID=2100421 RepID=A0A6J5NY65_9CAUD|nr:hypothetical protein UFOVP816_34 [uncultured Caudovirales phage]
MRKSDGTIEKMELKEKVAKAKRILAAKQRIKHQNALYSEDYNVRMKAKKEVERKKKKGI